MKTLRSIAGAITSFISSCIVMVLTNRTLDVLPVGNAYFADTPIHGLTYGEFFASLTIAFCLAYCIGLLHGFVYTGFDLRVLALAATVPLFLMMLELAAVTLGMGLITFPFVVAYGIVVARGIKRGGKLRLSSACARGDTAVL